jgi:hypothetical protein
MLYLRLDFDLATVRHVTVTKPQSPSLSHPSLPLLLAIHHHAIAKTAERYARPLRLPSVYRTLNRC